jgi:general secretion pathway protein E
MENQGLRDEDIDMGLLAEVPLSFAKGNLVMPLRRVNGSLEAAVSGEGGMLALRELASRYGLQPKPQTMPQDDVTALINRFYGKLGSASEVMDRISGEDFASVATEFERPRDLMELTEEAPIIRLLNALLQQAVKERASDIHVEPYEKDLEVRIRVDGALKRVLTPPKLIQDALISRIKIMARLDIAEKRLPQDGRIRLLVAGRDIDVRVSIVPTSFGERAVLRLLDRMHGIKGMNELGLSGHDLAEMERLLLRPNGLLLVTGPTGSGKTTTLYAALNRIHTEDKNIITVEDPVEYQIHGIGQIHVNTKVGLTFASGLRSILRQDPDVIMVGEIRDRETAEIAIQASLTGHLVLSTLHTNDSPSAVARLLEMGVEPFLAASSFAGALAQRLVRVLCEHCRESYSPSDTEAAYFEARPEKLWRAKGCERCGGNGYMGRLAIFELLVADDQLRQLISERAPAHRLKAHAVSRGMKSLRLDGLDKAVQGITTLQEVLRASQSDNADL